MSISRVFSECFRELRRLVNWSAESNQIEVHYDLATSETKPVQTCTGLYNACTACTIDTGMLCGHRGMARDVPGHSKVVVQARDIFTFDLRAQGGLEVSE